MAAAGSYYETKEGFAFSGEMEFIETEMYWPITHMVAPKENALQCADCHQWAEYGLDFLNINWVATIHVYMTTTGHTVTSNIQAMITGYEELDD